MHFSFRNGRVFHSLINFYRINVCQTPRSSQYPQHSSLVLTLYKHNNSCHGMNSSTGSICARGMHGGRPENMPGMGNMKEVGTSQTDASHSLHLLSIISFVKTHREPRRLALNGGKSNRFDALAGAVYFETQPRKLYVVSNEHYVLTARIQPQRNNLTE